MFAFFRTRRARPAADRATADCIASRTVDERTFEHLQSASGAGLGAELREWLPIAWADHEAAAACARCRA